MLLLFRAHLRSINSVCEKHRIWQNQLSKRELQRKHHKRKRRYLAAESYSLSRLRSTKQRPIAMNGDAVIRVYDAAGNVIETHKHAGGISNEP